MGPLNQQPSQISGARADFKDKVDGGQVAVFHNQIQVVFVNQQMLAETAGQTDGPVGDELSKVLFFIDLRHSVPEVINLRFFELLSDNKLAEKKLQHFYSSRLAAMLLRGEEEWGFECRQGVKIVECERDGAERNGLVCQLRPFDLKLIGGWRGSFGEYLRQDGEEQIAGEGNLTGEDDFFRIEDICKVSHAQPEPACNLFDSEFGGGLAISCLGDNVFDLDVEIIFSDEFAVKVQECKFGGEGIEAAAVSALAERTGGIDADVAEFTGYASGAGVDFSIDHNTDLDLVCDIDEDEVFCFPADADAGLGEGGQSYVVFYPGVASKLISDISSEFDSLPPGAEIGFGQALIFDVQAAWNTERDAEDIFAGTSIFDQMDQASSECEQKVALIFGDGWIFCVVSNRPAEEIGQNKLNAIGLEISADDVVSPGVDFE